MSNLTTEWAIKLIPLLSNSSVWRQNSHSDLPKSAIINIFVDSNQIRKDPAGTHMTHWSLD